MSRREESKRLLRDEVYACVMMLYQEGYRRYLRRCVDITARSVFCVTSVYPYYVSFENKKTLPCDRRAGGLTSAFRKAILAINGEGLPTRRYGLWFGPGAFRFLWLWKNF